MKIQIRNRMSLVVLCLVIISIKTNATDCKSITQKLIPSQAIEQRIAVFFSNYGIIAKSGFPEFQKAQSSLLATDMVTEVNSFGQTVTYPGPEGYFKSLGDWGANFSTESDFSTTSPTLNSNGAYEVRISGTITVTKDGKTSIVENNNHHWTETFFFDKSGRIRKLIVSMNINPDSLPK